MSNKNIFIVEDDPDILELMKLVVEGEGFRVKTFLESGRVHSEIAKQKPALVIMDLWVGSLDNSILVKVLKKDRATASVPIVLVSAKTALEKIAKQCGADGFLPKPFNIKDLVALVKKIA